MQDLKEGILYSYLRYKKKLSSLMMMSSQMANSFDDILKKLDAVSFLVEFEYVDRDYLEDYSSYYVCCHHRYERFCIRVHFFTKKNRCE